MVKMSLLLRGIGFFICGLLRCGADQLDVYFFNVGQASFTLLKTEREAVVIDCGTKCKPENVGEVHNKMKTFVFGVLGGNTPNFIKPLVLISHMDNDHYSGLGDFFPVRGREKVVVGGVRSEEDDDVRIPLELQGEDVRFFENKLRGRLWIADRDSSLMRGQENGEVFFRDNTSLRVACFFPKENKASKNRNEQSLMIKVTYAGKNILFPGDCSATLLGKLSQTEGFANFLGNIDVFVFSHHGDGHNGELNLFGVFAASLKQLGQQPHVPLCAIVSSNPVGVNHIPKNEVAMFGNPRILGITKQHEVSVYNLLGNKIEQRSTNTPIYVTSDAVMAYQLTIPSNGAWAELKNIDFSGRQVKSGFYPP